ncbi:GTP binding protein [Cryptosporidium ubiquitum]|uniref:GTP binding protein n=1 Tax=Cryptosporidium ubiquitum TaxID=857276 RepID=A0A1J4MJN5_9CRYT|nr:GTP binding protein [Cryptosporidium ubiquitum]OII73061.1 GTP binding protein [Cryptosporidium ubiquitum]
MTSIQKEYIIGCVGKPSSGKSTFFSSITDSSAKIGNYPFTTIEPNVGITHYIAECPCKKYNVICKPKYGSCNNGYRNIPIKMLDIAGLIPGAHLGDGLGNKFLDDLRHAHVLLHIIDISGNTNEKGEQTTNYNPINDHEWLRIEIEMWIFNNIYSNWSSIVRKSKTSDITISKLLLNQLSGYGCNELMIKKLISSMKLNDSADFSNWDKSDIIYLVRQFIKVRFPFVLVLNKADVMSENCDSNIVKFYEKYGDDHEIVVVSSLAEYFIKKMVSQNYIKLLYDNNSYNYSSFITSEDTHIEGSQTLKLIDNKLKSRLENIRDMVLFRHGVTGVQDAINKAVDLLGLIPVYPVKNIKTFTNDSYDEGNNFAFRDCILVPNGTTVKTLLKSLHIELDKNVVNIETVGGVKISENHLLSNQMNVIKITTAKYDEKNV